MMSRETVDLCLAALDRTAATTVDITGGAPELNPHFRYLVDECVARGKRVIDRCNLTVLLTGPCRDLPAWFAQRGVEIVCSLPHYRKRNTDLQRGDGTFEKSIEALRASMPPATARATRACAWCWCTTRPAPSWRATSARWRRSGRKGWRRTMA